MRKNTKVNNINELLKEFPEVLDKLKDGITELEKKQELSKALKLGIDRVSALLSILGTDDDSEEPKVKESNLTVADKKETKGKKKCQSCSATPEESECFKVQEDAPNSLAELLCALADSLPDGCVNIERDRTPDNNYNYAETVTMDNTDSIPAIGCIKADWESINGGKYYAGLIDGMVVVLPAPIFNKYFYSISNDGVSTSDVDEFAEAGKMHIYKAPMNVAVYKSVLPTGTCFVNAYPLTEYDYGEISKIKDDSVSPVLAYLDSFSDDVATDVKQKLSDYLYFVEDWATNGLEQLSDECTDEEQNDGVEQNEDDDDRG